MQNDFVILFTIGLLVDQGLGLGHGRELSFDRGGGGSKVKYQNGQIR